MPITDEKSVLILGAGASTQFDLPLGGELIELVVEQLTSEIRNINQVIYESGNGGDDGKRYGVQHLKIKGSYPKEYVFRHTPVMGTIIHSIIKNSDEPFKAISEVFNELMKSIETVIEYLHNQTADTIDAFIAENPSMSEVSRIAIACIFFNRLFKFTKGYFWMRKNQSSRQLEIGLDSENNPIYERNWVHLLINMVRHGTYQDPPTVSVQNPIEIITFNYDTVLEKILDVSFGNVEREVPDWRDLIKIIHVHGKMPELPNQVTEPFEFALEMANAISVATEIHPDKKVETDRSSAKILVRKSQKIYVGGFGFAGPNCKLLGFERISHVNQYIRFCNYDGNAGVSISAGRYGQHGQISNGRLLEGARPLVTIEEDAPLAGQKLSITNWFYLGALGELPA